MAARDEVLRREPRTLFAVGAAEGRGGDVFGSVGDVGFDAAENLYVLDRLNARVVVFDSTGRYLRAIGRRGGGPGELGAPQQMAVTRAGEVIVSDDASPDDTPEAMRSRARIGVAPYSVPASPGT